MLRGTFIQLHAAGCIQTGADVESDPIKARPRFESMLDALKLAAHGDPCNGCPAYHGGACKAFKQFNDRASRPATPRQPKAQVVKVAVRCPECLLKVRSPNHNEGDDHKRRTKGRGVAA